MPSDISEPPPGPPPADPPAHEPPALPTPEVASGTSSASNDDLTVSLTHGRPDPFLGEFVNPPAPGDENAPASAGPGPKSGKVAPVAEKPGRSSVSSSEALAGLDLTGNARPAATPPKPTPPGGDSSGDDDLDDDDSPPARGSSLPTMLLASYASAVTLGLVWVLWTGRRVREPTEIDFLPPADTRTDPGSRADRSRKLDPPPLIPADHLASLGDTVRLGKIEVTPVGVTSGPVRLERDLLGYEKKNGGVGALKLHLRLRNASDDTMIAPLDEAFLRDRPRSDPDTFIEGKGGGPTISQFPLAVESEWSIAGQEFRDLKPGEAFETVVVSAPNSLALAKGAELTWRVRLRTDINHTDVLGVRFSPSDIKPGP